MQTLTPWLSLGIATALALWAYRLGENLKQTMQKPFEAIEFAGKRFCLGVQWHPESLQSSEAQRRIFEAFITKARRKS